MVIKTSQDMRTMASAVRAVAQRLDPELPVYGVVSLDEITHLTRSVVIRQFVLYLIGAFSIVGALMAGVGLYGLMSFVVAQRSREIGIRVALGAKQWAVKSLVLNQAIRMTILGLLIGIALSIASGRLIQNVVYEVALSNPMVLISVSVIVGVITCAACYLPVRRALRLDPMTVLRHD
jgi:ABC-type antimicrobial peptide transport system permease subunit